MKRYVKSSVRDKEDIIFEIMENHLDSIIESGDFRRWTNGMDDEEAFESILDYLGDRVDEELKDKYDRHIRYGYIRSLIRHYLSEEWKYIKGRR